MCGIAGEIRFDAVEADAAAVGRIAETLRPRGPDASGTYQQGRVAFAHRRLKIIDLSERAQQPMVAPDLGLTLVFNGCIYNYRELRAELENLGERFFSDGDTEVLLRAYRHWGIGCVSRLHGMFAFAIHERDSGRVVLARDRFGIKPLYLAESADGRRLRFASSLPALLAGGDVDTRIDPVALEHYLMWHAVVPPPLTILRGVRKLPPATVAVFQPDGTRQDSCYWNPPFATDLALAAAPVEERERLVQTALEIAVERRMVADVPVGVLLSGGVDSSLIVSLLARAGQKDLNTFSIGFEAANGELGDEFKYSDLIAAEFGTRHHKMRIDDATLLATLPDAIRAMSEPMVSYDNIGFYLLSKEVSRHVKVVQSGQGADEVFAGYHWYPPLAASGDAVADYMRVFFDRDPEEYLRTVTDAYAAPGASRDFVAAHFARPGAATPLDRALRLDSTVMLVDDPVKRVDNMTMAWGLEARVPFLDHELVELAARLPEQDKLGDRGKAVLKSIARRLLPNEVIDRPKGYFPVPTLKYLSGPTLDWVRDALHSPSARARGLFREDYLDMLLAAPERHITPLRGSKLWQVALLELWLQSHGL
ncbi:MAG: N-acetylglutaminylglutamine amidotransferase [Aromatoleum sp.]|jgi:asparagine synthase (glutamine-hydrolysing)|uniref:N-acetylglutaminylglutamine amidotransferase n=1 Tax=Aromatoleum sp. TaxID=2307007 RepID=UPI002895245B|nr:N-acetylglutaminylglutamine amidotransferase [Aromatoleum sp.]MDT3670397.1 N-acetylglutaminylglutamine amidotransferase [Aromatoleum sp.]